MAMPLSSKPTHDIACWVNHMILISEISRVAIFDYCMLLGALNTIQAGRVGTFFCAHAKLRRRYVGTKNVPTLHRLFIIPPFKGAINTTFLEGGCFFDIITGIGRYLASNISTESPVVIFPCSLAIKFCPKNIFPSRRR